MCEEKKEDKVIFQSKNLDSSISNSNGDVAQLVERLNRNQKVDGSNPFFSTIKIYTDGAASGNPGPGGWACVIIDGDSVVEKVGGEKFTTNNRMELMAVIVALENCLQYKDKKITIYSDSTYVVKAVNEGWLKSWLAINFKKKKNEDLWRRFHQVYVQYSDVSFIMNVAIS